MDARPPNGPRPAESPSGAPAARAVERLATPALIVDVERMDANLRRAQRYADAQGVDLRPHSKTHKSPELARRQIEGGAVGICVAKLGEGEAMVDAGIDDLFMANTTFGEDKARRAVALAGRARFAIGADHPEQIAQLAEAAREASRPLEVMIEVDSGAGRGGAPAERVPDLLRAVREAPGLRARGLYTYEGYTYDASDAAELAARHREAQRLIVDVAGATRDLFDAPPVVSIGSTPSLLAEVDLLPGITEIRPGTSIFLDAAQAALAGGVEHAAAHVLATVVSVQPGRAILDAGSKSLTSDARAGGVTATRGHGLIVDPDLIEAGLTVARLSEEHGVVEDPAAERLEVGRTVRILPNHICPVVNLFPSLWLVRGGRVERELPIVGRGLLV